MLERLAVGKAGREQKPQVGDGATRVPELYRARVLFIDGYYSGLQATRQGIDRHLTS